MITKINLFTEHPSKPILSEIWVDETSATFSWTGADNAVKFLLQYHLVETQQWDIEEFPANKQKQYTLKNLTPQTKYEVIINLHKILGNLTPQTEHKTIR